MTQFAGTFEGNNPEGTRVFGEWFGNAENIDDAETALKEFAEDEGYTDVDVVEVFEATDDDLTKDVAEVLN